MRLSPIIRPATPADAATIADIHARSRASIYRGILSEEYLDHELAAESLTLWVPRLNELCAGAGGAFIAEAEGEPAAFACVLAPDVTGSAYIDSLHALPHRKGIGAGTALLDAATHWARMKGATRMHLRVIDRNDAAIRFYEARGWARIDSLDDVMGGTLIVALIYSISLVGG